MKRVLARHRMSALNRSVIGSISAEEANRFPRCWQKKLWIPRP
jgi:hypothetical protein